MGVYIKGMKMPHNCLWCPLSVLNGERLYCEVTKDEVLRTKRDQECPLTEIDDDDLTRMADAYLRQERKDGNIHT